MEYLSRPHQSAPAVACIDPHSVILRRSAGLGARDHILNPRPLGIRQFIASYCHLIASMFFSTAFLALVQFPYEFGVFRYALVFTKTLITITLN